MSTKLDVATGAKDPSQQESRQTTKGKTLTASSSNCTTVLIDRHEVHFRPTCCDDLSAVQTNLDAAHAAASAVGNQDNDSTPVAAQGSGPGINKVHTLGPLQILGTSTARLSYIRALQSGSVEQNAPSAGNTNQKGDH